MQVTIKTIEYKTIMVIMASNTDKNDEKQL